MRLLVQLVRVDWFLFWVICSQYICVSGIESKSRPERNFQVLFVALILLLLVYFGLWNPWVGWAIGSTVGAAIAVDRFRTVWSDLGFGFEFEVISLMVGYALIWWTAPYLVGTPSIQYVKEFGKDLSIALAWLAAILLTSSPSNRLVRLFLEKGGRITPPQEVVMEGQKFVLKESNGAYRAGALIGNLERLIVLSLTVYGKIDAVALLFAGKGLVRFKKFEEHPEFGEYFILGTLSSAAIAVAIALVTKQLLAL